jgi:hypothetical protein
MSRTHSGRRRTEHRGGPSDIPRWVIPVAAAGLIVICGIRMASHFTGGGSTTLSMQAGRGAPAEAEINDAQPER